MTTLRKVATLEGWENLETIAQKFNMLVHAVRQLQDLLTKLEGEKDAG